MSMMKSKVVLTIALFVGAASAGFAAEVPDGQVLFKKKCGLCHGIDKKKLGPAIKTMSNQKAVLKTVITEGKGAMPGYEGKLTGAQIDALVSYLLANQ